MSSHDVWSRDVTHYKPSGFWRTLVKPFIKSRVDSRKSCAKPSGFWRNVLPSWVDSRKCFTKPGRFSQMFYQAEWILANVLLSRVDSRQTFISRTDSLQVFFSFRSHVPSVLSYVGRYPIEVIDGIFFRMLVIIPVKIIDGILSYVGRYPIEVIDSVFSYVGLYPSKGKWRYFLSYIDSISFSYVGHYLSKDNWRYFLSYVDSISFRMLAIISVKIIDGIFFRMLTVFPFVCWSLSQ